MKAWLRKVIERHQMCKDYSLEAFLKASDEELRQAQEWAQRADDNMKEFLLTH